MRFGIVGRYDVPERLEVARDLVKRLDGRAEVTATPRLAQELDVPGTRLAEMDDADVDMLLTVGGDGTILYTLLHSGLPICGINMGEMGFLTTSEPEDLSDTLDRLLAGEYEIVERMKVQPRLNDEVLPSAANEVVVKTPRPSRVLTLRLDADGKEAMEVVADGLIVASPTGCTGYSLSAGGPFVDPRVETFIVVPLAPFNLHARPLLLPPESTLELTLVEPDKMGLLSVDGQVEREVHPGDVLTLTRSPEVSRFVRFDQHFAARVRERFP